MSLAHPLATILVAQVAQDGIAKYGKRNWEEYAKDWNWCQLYDSADRHLKRWLLRQDMDPSGRLHLAHAAWNIMALLELTERGLGIDDRTLLPTDVDKYFPE
jgi:DNA-binding transcriptional regulator/RsmH inhibitor MraZ